jgi:hypothetical protein
MFIPGEHGIPKWFVVFPGGTDDGYDDIADNLYPPCWSLEILVHFGQIIIHTFDIIQFN